MAKRQADDVTVAGGRQWAADYPLPTHGPYCSVEVHTKHSGVRFKFTCTREANHVGPHVAHIPGGSAAAVWENEQKFLG